MSEKNVIWSGSALDPSGYGEATRGYLLGLDRFKDLNIKLSVRSFWQGDPPDLRQVWPTLAKMQQAPLDRRKPYVFIQHLTPDAYMLGAGKCIQHIGVTTFETTSLPAGWQVNMRSMDELWTFSHWAKSVFEECGIKRRITVVPHGVDIIRFRPGIASLPGIRWTPNGGKEPQVNAGQTFIFGADFDWTDRKNPKALIQAYLSNFSASEDVALLLKVYYQHPIERSMAHIKSEIASYKRELGITKAPKIILLTDILPANQVPNFYATCNAYVLPSRGEGWGLTYSEAMASGLPTVAVNWSGHTEFMNDNNSVLCKDFKLREITKQQAGAQTQYVGHQWADVNIEELGLNMRRLFDDRDFGTKIGQQARKDMQEKFTWAACTKAAKARLDEIFAGENAN